MFAFTDHFPHMHRGVDFSPMITKKCHDPGFKPDHPGSRGRPWHRSGPQNDPAISSTQVHLWCPPPHSAGLDEAARRSPSQKKNRAYQAGRFPAGQSHCDQRLSLRALKGRRRHVDASAAPPLTALDPLEQEISRNTPPWTFLSTLLWTSTAHRRGHDHRGSVPPPLRMGPIFEAVVFDSRQAEYHEPTPLNHSVVSMLE